MVDEKPMGSDPADESAGANITLERRGEEDPGLRGGDAHRYQRRH